MTPYLLAETFLAVDSKESMLAKLAAVAADFAEPLESEIGTAVRLDGFSSLLSGSLGATADDPSVLEYVLGASLANIECEALAMDLPQASPLNIRVYDLTRYVAVAVSTQLSGTESVPWSKLSVELKRAAIFEELLLVAQRTKRGVFLVTVDPIAGSRGVLRTLRQRDLGLVFRGMMKTPDWEEWFFDEVHGPITFCLAFEISALARGVHAAYLREQQPDRANALLEVFSRRCPQYLFPKTIEAAQCRQDFKYRRIIDVLSAPLQLECILRGEEIIARLEWGVDEMIEAIYQLGWALYEERRLNDALKVFDLIVEHSAFPPNAVVHNARGLCNFRLQQYDAAISEYETAIELTRQRPMYNAYENLGRVFMKLEQYHKALECFSRALALNPQNAWGYRNRARIYEKLGEQEKADVDWRNCVKHGGSPPGGRGRKRSPDRTPRKRRGSRGQKR